MMDDFAIEVLIGKLCELNQDEVDDNNEIIRIGWADDGAFDKIIVTNEIDGFISVYEVKITKLV